MTLTKEEGCFKNTKFDVTSGSKKKKFKLKAMIKKALYHFNDEEWQTPIESVWFYITTYFNKVTKENSI